MNRPRHRFQLAQAAQVCRGGIASHQLRGLEIGVDGNRITHRYRRGRQQRTRCDPSGIKEARALVVFQLVPDGRLQRALHGPCEVTRPSPSTAPADPRIPRRGGSALRQPENARARACSRADMRLTARECSRAPGTRRWRPDTSRGGPPGPAAERRPATRRRRHGRGAVRNREDGCRLIARQHETAIAVIPDRARKRAAQPLEAACAPAVVGVCNQLLVVPREEAMSFALECGAQFAAVGQL